jgi:hypothetical protein
MLIGAIERSPTGSDESLDGTTSLFTRISR